MQTVMTAPRHRRALAGKLRGAGFTLIELLIAIAIVAILVRIALPSYSKYVQRGDITEATQALAQFRVQMEQYYQDNGNYGTAGVGCGSAYSGTQVNFTFACALGATPQSYTATMTGKAGSAMAGFGYSINQANAQVTTALPAGWSPATAAVQATSWVTQ